MKSPDDFSINLAYSYKNSEELSKYYDDSAKDYDRFTESVGYVLHKRVAEKASHLLNTLRRTEEIIDIGCGTGLLGLELGSNPQNIRIDGIDISPEMVFYAYNKKKQNGRMCYRKIYIGDISNQNQIQKNTYSFMVSSGTFTTGHLDAGHLLKIIRMMQADSYAVFSVKSDHFQDSGFMGQLERLVDSELIEIIEISEVDSYENPGYTALSKIITIKIP
jgi:predicted TPR repeat methyltransferase